MQNKCKSLEDKVTSLEENLNCLDHYGRTNNIVYSGMLECVADDALEATVASILSDIDVDVDSNALEECHRFGKPERRTKSRKTIVRFTNRKYCKKALLNWKKLANLDNEKHQLGSSTTIFISKNENIAFKARKLKRRGAIHGYFRRDGVVHIKLSEHDKAIKILHKNHFCKYILDHDEEEEDLFHDVTGSKQLCSVQLLRKLICWLFYWVSGLLWVVFFMWATSVVLRELNFEILEQMISTKKTDLL